MKKGVTTVLMAVATVLLYSVSIFGQAAQSSSQSVPGAEAQPNSINDKDVEMLRANLRANRKELMAQNMNLTADEATKFWPIFDQYRKEAIKPNDDRWALIKEYAANYNTMTDAQAEDYMKKATAVDQQLVALRLRYVPVFEKIISAKKTALWYQIDRHIDLMINLQLSSMIPMVNTTR
jgi:Spy/CpxP family protein refolding chaperone